MNIKHHFYKILTTQELLKNIKNANWIIVDTRISDAYNGWAVDEITRGGHIPSAVDFSAMWLLVQNNNKEKVLDNALITKGITKDKNVVLYDSNGKDSKQVALYLASKGYENLYIYNIHDWASHPTLEMIRYPNYSLLVPPYIVNRILKGVIPQTFDKNKQIKFVETSWGDKDVSYSSGHIPGAFHIDTNCLESYVHAKNGKWTLSNDDILAEFAFKNGFTKDDCVIISGKNQLAAYRVAVILKYIGISDVRVLNGTDNAWVQSGYKLELRETTPSPCKNFGGKIPICKHIIDTEQDIKNQIKNPQNFVLVDIRTWKEYIGATSGYSYISKSGRIPGAVYGNVGEGDVNSLVNYRNIDGTMRNGYEILKMLQNQGINTNKHLSFMCGSGWRASEVYTYAAVMGLKNISVYSDGWGGWSSDLQNHIESGVPFTDY